jgi:chemotaxis protein methyltransferase CheR
MISSSASEVKQPKLRRHEFDMICRMMYDSFGIDLEGKEVLVEARLGKKLRELEMRSFEQYWEMVKNDRSGEALTAMVDVLTTNHTSFFRENQHFNFLQTTVLPELRGKKQIRIWSAACSTGEEPYSIAFTLLQGLGVEAISRVDIFATDISTRVLAAAKQGVYSADRFRSMPTDQQRRFLLKGSGASEGSYLVKKEIRSAIAFERLNLMEDFAHVGLFSVIFCRNVMIYFDQKTQESLVNRLAKQLEPGGYLLIGHAESLNGINHNLKYICPATYRNSVGSSTTFHRRRSD